MKDLVLGDLAFIEACRFGLDDCRGHQEDENASESLVHLEAVDGACVVVLEVFDGNLDKFGHLYTQVGLPYQLNEG